VVKLPDEVAFHLFNSFSIPSHIYKKNNTVNKSVKNILIYNTCKGMQHSRLELSKK